ncbi:branched-chain amino acid aminotransferase [Bartonella tamiae]|uniref:Probable branched-chain-amino-acid aminotransferase n=1 Tax=Bartonella tamiae Th239 TaxID=1094558 RepID=J1JWB1_9HYPH|nr:branched-chain amino acid aminotransferase [Bartonella tamiae]EJF88875.1 branched-chain amino acid aminotransferase [Bartonella tamiae Th239]EJF94875.1 branched-chain amino acid aminotransferase [Bartonella tamiae Th307]
MTTSNPNISFTIQKNTSSLTDTQRSELLKNPGFGQVFTDHMARADWSEEKGWHNAQISAKKPFEIDPASAVLHYGQEVFEGLKAYRAKDGRVLLFRPEENAKRLQQSAKRLAMPQIPEEMFLEAIYKLVDIDKLWIPNTPNSSLYLRPFMFANENFLGVRPAKNYIFCVIASPVETYFKNGSAAVNVWLETEYSRAGPGGTGSAKCGGNYASSLLAQNNAYANKCDQVLFLDVIEHKWIEELGGMNVCFITQDNHFITPPLDGTILPGITRDAILKIARDQNLIVEERPYSFDNLKQDAKSGYLKEVFACGTAAVITPIGCFKYKDGETIIGNGEGGLITQNIKKELVSIQTGEKQDKYGWVKEI